MRHLLIAAVVSAILLGAGVYHGLATDRWTTTADLDAPNQQVANLRMDIGDWVGERLPRQEDEDSKIAATNTRLVNRINGRWVITSITSGRAGRVAIHNPEHCYLGNGYKLADGIREESIALPDGAPARFWTGHFQKKKATGFESIRIWWGWTTDGRWEAPTYPRLFFAGKPRLHKLYVIHPAPTDDVVEDLAPYREFMTQYLTELNRHLGP